MREEIITSIRKVFPASRFTDQGYIEIQHDGVTYIYMPIRLQLLCLYTCQQDRDKACRAIALETIRSICWEITKTK